MKTIWEGEIEYLAPLFCRGAYKNQPEIRVPSIRGMVRWWFRKLGGTAAEEKILFGGMKKFASDNTVHASNLVIRVISEQVVGVGEFSTLPHKHGGDSNPQYAFKPNGSFALKVFSRFDRLKPDSEIKVKNAIEVWTLLGALGLRANRAGGSLWPVGELAPETAIQLRTRLNAAGFKWPVYLAPEAVGTAGETLRAAATDTVEGHPQVFGSIRRPVGRLSSPLKIKVIRLDGKLRLLITAPTESMIREAQAALKGHLSQPEGWMPI